MNDQVTVKAWYLSTSTWVALATIAAAIYESNLIPHDSPGFKILGLAVAAATALGLIAKRGLIEAATVKANAVASIAAANPTQPPKP